MSTESGIKSLSSIPSRQ
ncbi:hypothetical protein Godav_025183 [Gossypium davidsonii]|uniref:Uncharacterized protein n=1 Tax=Gossypium davidsonii TaxID=34287 RepID=A0A7J8TA01_GOSDV|nr:hypothetical protein [Gossypium davidsonii]